ncbi:MAG: hypothetical protein ACE5IR_11810 [bacterium]
MESKPSDGMALIYNEIKALTALLVNNPNLRRIESKVMEAGDVLNKELAIDVKIVVEKRFRTSLIHVPGEQN